MKWLDEHFERLKKDKQITKVIFCADGTLLLKYATGRIEVIRR